MILLWIICLFGFENLQSQTIDVHITNIRNTKGQLCFAIFADQAGFNVEKTCWEMKCSKKDIVNGKLSIKIPFHAGKWAFSVLDDENSTGKMEYNIIGIPRKGFGFSNYVLKGIHKPVFTDFCFNIDKNEIKIIYVVMTYF